MTVNPYGREQRGLKSLGSTGFGLQACSSALDVMAMGVFDLPGTNPFILGGLPVVPGMLGVSDV